MTNNSAALLAEHEAALASIGVPAEGSVISSAQAAAHVLPPGSTAYVAGEAGVREALQARGVELAEPPHVDAVVVGYHRWFDYHSMHVASDAVRRGARLVGTNDDATYPTPQGLIPGGGAILAAIATAAGVQPTVVGKPHQPMADLVRLRLGASAEESLAGVVMVGDRPDTDGLFAQRLGCRYAQVFSGVFAEGDAGVATHIEAANLAGVAEQLLAAQR